MFGGVSTYQNARTLSLRRPSAGHQGLSTLSGGQVRLRSDSSRKSWMREFFSANDTSRCRSTRATQTKCEIYWSACASLRRGSPPNTVCSWRYQDTARLGRAPRLQREFLRRVHTRTACRKDPFCTLSGGGGSPRVFLNYGGQPACETRLPRLLRTDSVRVP